MDVSIIIVNFNTKHLLENCLTSIYEKTKDILFEVIVSDNGSKDGSIEMIKNKFPQVILLENNDNLGFGKANNKGLLKASGKYILYLNSDTVLLNNAVKYFYTFYQKNEDNNIGGIGAFLLDENNSYIHSGGSFPEINTVLKKTFYDLLRIIKLNLFSFSINPFSPRKYNSNKLIPENNKEVDYITGADLFLPNNSLAKFDESFFLYYEDTDLQKNIKEKTGKKFLLINGPKIQHLEHKSNNYSSKINYYTSITKLNHTLSGFRFFNKYHEKPIKIKILKELIILQWINPRLYKKTKTYLNELKKIERIYND